MKSYTTSHKRSWWVSKNLIIQRVLSKMKVVSWKTPSKLSINQMTKMIAQPQTLKARWALSPVKRKRLSCKVKEFLILTQGNKLLTRNTRKKSWTKLKAKASRDLQVTNLSSKIIYRAVDVSIASSQITMFPSQPRFQRFYITQMIKFKFKLQSIIDKVKEEFNLLIVISDKKLSLLSIVMKSMENSFQKFMIFIEFKLLKVILQRPPRSKRAQQDNRESMDNSI